MGEPSQPANIKALVNSLNALLDNLHLPIYVESPLDLTPALLLGILECILRSRLPISPSIRRSKDLASKIHAMKIFLGVLENDVIGEDVGLSDVDPRKLAVGEWDEVVFVGELLSWLGKREGIMSFDVDNGNEDGEDDYAALHDIEIYNTDADASEAEKSSWSMRSYAYDEVSEINGYDHEETFMVSRETSTREPEYSTPTSSKSRSGIRISSRTSTPSRDSSAYTTLSFIPSAPSGSDFNTTIHSHIHPGTRIGTTRTYSPPLSDIDIFGSSTQTRDFRTSSPVPPSPTSSSSRLPSTQIRSGPVPEESIIFDESRHERYGDATEDLEDFELPSWNPIGHSTFQIPTDSDEDEESLPLPSHPHHHHPHARQDTNTENALLPILTPPQSRIPVRYSGYLREIDPEEELHSFDLSRSREAEEIQKDLARLTVEEREPIPASSPFGPSSTTTTSVGHNPESTWSRTWKNQNSGGGARYPSSLSRTQAPASTATRQDTATGTGMIPTYAQRIVTRHNSPSQHALALLNERARLKTELAQIKARRRS